MPQNCPNYPKIVQMPPKYTSYPPFANRDSVARDSIYASRPVQHRWLLCKCDFGSLLFTVLPSYFAHSYIWIISVTIFTNHVVIIMTGTYQPTSPLVPTQSRACTQKHQAGLFIVITKWQRTPRHIKLYQMILKIKPRMILSSYVGGSVLSIVDSSQRRRGWVKIQMTANASQMTAAVQRVTLLLGAKNAEHFLVKVHYSALQDKYLSSPYLAAGKFN